MDSIIADDFVELAAEVGAKDFDLMLVGDGSGTTADLPFGWYCACYRPRDGRVLEHAGCATAGSVSVAELGPATFGVWAYRHVLWHAHRESPAPTRVVIVSDSQSTVRCGTGEYSRAANLPLWAAFDWLERHGWAVSWHWVPRNSNPVSKRADRVAGRARAAAVNLLTP